MLNSLKYKKELDKLRADHENIEIEIEKEMKSKITNQFGLQRLKKTKLALKEQISALEALLMDNVVA